MTLTPTELGREVVAANGTGVTLGTDDFGLVIDIEYLAFHGMAFGIAGVNDAWGSYQGCLRLADVAAVTEPGSLAMLGLGLISLGPVRRYRTYGRERL